MIVLGGDGRNWIVIGKMKLGTSALGGGMEFLGLLGEVVDICVLKDKLWDSEVNFGGPAI